MWRPGNQCLDAAVPSAVFLLVSAMFLATFCWQNRNRAGIVVLAIGIILNVSVMVANGGTMPISSITLQRMQSIPGRLVSGHRRDLDAV